MLWGRLKSCDSCFPFHIFSAGGCDFLISTAQHRCDFLISSAQGTVEVGQGEVDQSRHPHAPATRNPRSSDSVRRDPGVEKRQIGGKDGEDVFFLKAIPFWAGHSAPLYRAMWCIVSRPQAGDVQRYSGGFAKITANCSERQHKEEI